MLNKKPIFIVAFSRGGSNILLNLLRSHPEVCSPRGETQQVFKGKPSGESYFTRIAKKLRYWSIYKAEGADIFDMNHWKPRKTFKLTSQNKIDQILFKEKLKATAPSQNLYKTEGVYYTSDEIAKARLLCKNLDGLIFLSQEFARNLLFLLGENMRLILIGNLRK